MPTLLVELDFVVGYQPDPAVIQMTMQSFAAAGMEIYFRIDPAAAGFPIIRERQDDVTLNCVMSNSFGFGGTNATLVFKRYDE